jgi:hypothetical protein
MKEPDDPTLRVYTPRKPDRRPGLDSAGQSGDDQGLYEGDVEGGESIAELAREGQYFEAEAVSGTERPDVDEKEVRTHARPEDDVPLEYPARDSGLESDPNP